MKEMIIIMIIMIIKRRRILLFPKKIYLRGARSFFVLIWMNKGRSLKFGTQS